MFLQNNGMVKLPLVPNAYNTRNHNQTTVSYVQWSYIIVTCQSNNYNIPVYKFNRDLNESRKGIWSQSLCSRFLHPKKIIHHLFTVMRNSLPALQDGVCMLVMYNCTAAKHDFSWKMQVKYIRNGLWYQHWLFNSHLVRQGTEARFIKREWLSQEKEALSSHLFCLKQQW